MGYTPHILVIGGGAVGTATARDLAIRGLDVTLVEADTLASGRTGRSTAILDSGATIAESAPDVAQSCIDENRTLFEIAQPYIDDTGGLIVQHESNENFEELLDACDDAGIAAKQISAERARELEPGLPEDIEGAIRVPDGVIDPFQVTIATARDAASYGVDFRIQTTVTDIQVDDGSIAGVEIRHDPRPEGRDLQSEEEADEETDDDAEEREGVEMPVDDPDAPIATEADETDEDYEESEPEDDADDVSQALEEAKEAASEEEELKPRNEEIYTDDDQVDAPEGAELPQPDDGPDPPPGPGHATRAAVAGSTTAGTIPGTTGEPDKPELEVSEGELDVDYVVNAAGGDAPEIATLADISLSIDQESTPRIVAANRPTDHVVRAYTATDASVTPFDEHAVLAGGEHAASLSPAVVDQAQGNATAIATLEGNNSLRAFCGPAAKPEGEQSGASHHDFSLVDHGQADDCWGMTTVLGGSITTHRLVAEQVSDDVCAKFGITRECQTDSLPLPENTLGDVSVDGVNPVICECQSVRQGAASTALEAETAGKANLDEIRGRTGATMGECQGGRCAHRLAAELSPGYDSEIVDDSLDDLLASRWEGQRPALAGESLERAARMYRLHAATMARKHRQPETVTVDDFDSGPTAASPGERHGEGWDLDPDHCCLRGVPNE